MARIQFARNRAVRVSPYAARSTVKQDIAAATWTQPAPERRAPARREHEGCSEPGTRTLTRPRPAVEATCVAHGWLDSRTGEEVLAPNERNERNERKSGAGIVDFPWEGWILNHESAPIFANEKQVPIL
jgi:hypothetical protein